MNWTWGDTHFLLSDNNNHLFSGFHIHRGSQTMRPQDKRKERIEQEDDLLMRVVKEYMRFTL